MAEAAAINLANSPTPIPAAAPPATPVAPSNAAMTPVPPAGLSGTPPASWRDALPEDIRGNAAISSFTDVAALAKSHIHAQAQMGKKGVIPPAANATDEEWQNFSKAMGVPEMDKYEMSLPKDITVDAERLSAIKELAVKEGIHPRHMSKLVEWQARQDIASEQAETKEVAEIAAAQMKELQTEWGDNFNKQVAKAQLVVKEHGGERFLKYLQDTGMGQDVELIRFCANVSKLMAEDKFRESGISGEASDPASIKEQLDTILKDGGRNGYWDKTHPNHYVTLGKVESLRKQLTNGR